MEITGGMQLCHFFEDFCEYFFAFVYLHGTNLGNFFPVLFQMSIPVVAENVFGMSEAILQGNDINAER